MAYIYIESTWLSFGRQDDDMRTSLRAQMTSLRPSELILPSQGVSRLTRKVLMATLRQPRVNTLAAGIAFWPAAKTLEEFKAAKYFKGVQLSVS